MFVGRQLLQFQQVLIYQMSTVVFNDQISQTIFILFKPFHYVSPWVNLHNHQIQSILTITHVHL